MKTRIIAAVAALLALPLFAIPSSGQTVQKHLDSAGGISSVVASNSFQVIYRYDDYYSVDWSVDQLLQDYVEVYVRNGVLNLSFNEKSLPKELKKTFRGRNAPKIILRATVHGPGFSNLTLSDDAVFDASGTSFQTETFTMNLSGNAKCTNLSVASEGVRVEMTKNSAAVLDLGSDDIEINLSDKTVLNLKQDSDRMNISLAGSSSLVSEGDSKEVLVSASNSSSASLVGSAMSLSVNSSNNSTVDASSFQVNDASIVANSSTVYVNAAENLSLDLRSGAKVYFQEDPSIQVVDILSSTLSRSTGEKRR